MFFCKLRHPFKLLGSIAAKIYSYHFYQWLSYKWCEFYSSWVLTFIPNADENVHISPGLNLLGGDQIYIGNGTIFGNNCVLNCWKEYGKNKEQKLNPILRIGSNCNFGEYTHITCANKITIGNNLLTGRRCLITDNAHGSISYEDLSIPPTERLLYSKGEIVIDDNVWLGDRVCVCAGVHIGKGAVIAANAVVTHDVPAFSLAAGVPARIVKTVKK